MRNIFFTSLIFSLCLASCHNSSRMDKDYVIPRDKFVDVLVEMHIMDAVTNAPEYYRKFGKNDSVNIYAGIFRKYDVTQAQFDSTMVMYTRQPDKYLKVYDDVILKLNLKRDKMLDNEPSFQKEDNKKEKEKDRSKS